MLTFRDHVNAFIWAWLVTLCCMIGSVLIVAILIFLGWTVFAVSAHAENYIVGYVAEVECPRQSNEDELECDSADTLAFGLGGGWIEPVGWAEVWYGPQVSYRRGDLHGMNMGQDLEATADGKHIKIYGLQGHLELNVPVYDPLSAFVAVEPGICLVDAFGDKRAAGCAGGHAGLRLTYGNAFLSIGYTAFATTPTKHDGFRSEYWDHGPRIQLGWRF